MAEMYCSNCGVNVSNLKETARFCPSCGEVLERKEKPVVTNTSHVHHHTHVHVGRGPFNKWLALLLLLFLGPFGAHKFYEGKIFMGILYLFTLGFFGIGLLFDFFALLFKPTEYYL